MRRPSAPAVARAAAAAAAVAPDARRVGVEVDAVVEVAEQEAVVELHADVERAARDAQRAEPRRLEDAGDRVVARARQLAAPVRGEVARREAERRRRARRLDAQRDERAALVRRDAAE